MSQSLNNNQHPAGVAIITGAAGGMGAATARELVSEGWRNLLLCDHNEAKLNAVATPLRELGAHVEILSGDLSESGWPNQLKVALGDQPVAALIHSAAVSPQMANPQRILEVNLDATIRLVETVRERMANGAAAVLFSSNSAHMPMPAEAAAAFWAPLPEGGALALAHLTPSQSLAYPLSKIGVRALAKREAPAFGKRGARIVSLSPGAIDTEMGRIEGAASPIVQKMIERSGIGRAGRAEELAAVAAFLCSSKASFVTGVDWLVDGGQTAGLGF